MAVWNATPPTVENVADAIWKIYFMLHPYAAFPNFQHKVMVISSEIADGLHAIFGHNPCGGRVLFGHDGGRVAGLVVVRIGFVAASHADEKKGHGKEWWRGGKWG